MLYLMLCGDNVLFIWSQCQACGKLDNLEGCMTGYHVSADPLDKKASRLSQPGHSAFLTWRAMWINVNFKELITVFGVILATYKPENNSLLR